MTIGSGSKESCLQRLFPSLAHHASAVMLGRLDMSMGVSYVSDTDMSAF